ncbi:MAG: hypothetical protein K8T89_00150 [Planctomycetes bacterium]|nr:hypothetical protein [Planctomycetota bacterium]
MKTIKTLLAALVISFFSLGGAQAQTKPATALSETELKEKLESLGHDVKPVALNNNRTGYYIDVTFKGQKASMFVQVSPSGSYVWGTLDLADLKPEHAAEGARLFKLLQLNQAEGPNHFYVTPDGKRLCITRGLFNKSLTTKELREHIDGLLGAATATVDHWNVTTWTAPPAVGRMDK